MKKLVLGVGLAVGVVAVAIAMHEARKTPEKSSVTTIVSSLPSSGREEVAAPPAASAPKLDTEMGRLVLPPTPRTKAPADDEWMAAERLPLPRAKRCTGMVLDGWIRLECEARTGQGHSVAALSGSLTLVSMRPSERGIVKITFPVARGDRRMFQLEDVEQQVSGAGYRGTETESVVIPSVVVSVVWLEKEDRPRIVVADV